MPVVYAGTKSNGEVDARKVEEIEFSDFSPAHREAIREILLGRGFSIEAVYEVAAVYEDEEACEFFFTLARRRVGRLAEKRTEKIKAAIIAQRAILHEQRYTFTPF